jgi:hypothetical protein
MADMARAVAALLLSLVLIGCDQPPPPPPGTVRLPTEDFSIGPPARYRTPGVHDALRESHGVWVCSDERMIVVLSAACPHDGRGTYFDPMTVQFRCSRCSARFSDMGLPLSGRPDNLALVRLRLSLHGERGDPEAALWVNPRVTYRFEKNEWSSRFSLWMFEPVE